MHPDHPVSDRREFLRTALTCAAPLVVPGLAAARSGADSKPAGLPIVDPHQHLWDLEKFRLPWITKGSPLNRSYLLKDYAEATKGLNVVQTVYMEVDVDPKQQLAEAEYVTELSRKPGSKLAGAVISGRPGSKGFREYVERFKGSPFIKGLRQVLHGESTTAGYCLDKAFIKGIQLLGELGLGFDLCMRAAELPDAARLVDACPGTRFILDHCGNPVWETKDLTAWKKDLADLARRKNVVCKVSGIVARAKPGRWTADDLAPVVNHTLDTFGPDRVMFAGDWPVCTLGGTFRQWVEALQLIVKGRSETEQRKLFHDNAVGFYGLKVKGA
jgi:predicted TIM-barrel fold metal-dependent hydrolase